MRQDLQTRGAGRLQSRAIPALAAGIALLLSSACQKSVEASTLQDANAKEQAGKQEKGRVASKFSRLVDLGYSSGHFDTAIARYKDKKGRTVDLVAAVHIGDLSYFKELQKRFRANDAVLYELVAPKGKRPTKGKKGSSMISMLQRGMKNALKLEFQLDAVDYTPENFVHADMSPKEFLAQWEKGGGMTKLVLRAMMASGAQAQGAPKFGLVHILAAMMTKDSSRYLKFLFAHQLGDMENMIAVFGGGSKGGKSALIGKRNGACMKVLDEELGKGKSKLAIFYGAAHMQDMEERLWKRGFHKISQDWIMAWDVRLSEEEMKKAKAKAEKAKARKKRRPASRASGGKSNMEQGR